MCDRLVTFSSHHILQRTFVKSAVRLTTQAFGNWSCALLWVNCNGMLDLEFWLFQCWAVIFLSLHLQTRDLEAVNEADLMWQDDISSVSNRSKRCLTTAYRAVWLGLVQREINRIGSWAKRTRLVHRLLTSFFQAPQCIRSLPSSRPASVLAYLSLSSGLVYEQIAHRNLGLTDSWSRGDLQHRTPYGGKRAWMRSTIQIALTNWLCVFNCVWIVHCLPSLWSWH